MFSVCEDAVVVSPDYVLNVLHAAIAYLDSISVE